MKARWENNLKLIIDKYLSSDGYQWKMLIARDYGDRIIVFHSDIHVDSSSKVKVKETIVVFNGSGDRSPDIDYNVTYDPNNDIQRGIVRDFPTIYLDSNGFYYSVGFNLLSVTHNGKKAGYKTEYLNNGQRIFVGEESVFIPDGLHTYVFEYETTRQIIHHDDKDELYWNVNGNGWVFYADSVSCTIQFPEGSRIVEDACYTGVQGSTDRYCRSDRLAPDRIHFYNLARFNPWEGLTVAASVQKGVLVPAPPRTWKEILQDNYGIGLLAIALAFLLIFYFTAWIFKGRDPKKGTIFPQFEPPAGLSPPDVGYIHKQQYGSHLFVAALVDMAVKKY
ncbi:MAG: DUF2207 domain-containing protein, partial [Chitinophagaceae bacterium]|nr:DUF2207 domain-containing protein [Chitinophagaceae bacterium]